MAITEQIRLISVLTAETARRMRGINRLFSDWRQRFIGKVPERVAMAPQDLWTADPVVAREIYSGEFNLASKTVFTGAQNPFAVVPPSEYWSRELHEFRWLRHLDAANNGISGSNAKALVEEWIITCGRHNTGIAWRAEIAAVRLISWLCHCPAILVDADREFHTVFLKSIGRHVSYLRAAQSNVTDGMPRLLVHIALAQAALCVVGLAALNRTAHQALDRELERQVFDDGVHCQRNPEDLAKLLAELMPLRQSHLSAGRQPSAVLIGTIDRVFPAIRFFRHGDGSLALFNGCSVTRRDLVSTVMRYDEALGEPASAAVHGGFQRIDQGGSVLLMDVGRPVAGQLSDKAHAGCLSFEFSRPDARLVINCGQQEYPSTEIRNLARSTAAHSTACVNDTSSSRFQAPSAFARYLGAQIVSGVSKVSCRRSQDDNRTMIEAVHNGYEAPFGLRHRRTIEMADDGTVLDGLDHLTYLYPKPGRSDQVCIRFHLHPDVKAVKAGGVILATMRNSEVWKFSCTQVEPQIEDSIFFACSSGMRLTQQITLSYTASDAGEISWRFDLHSAEASANTKVT